MTVRSVIDIDVDQAKWNKFQQLFDKYSATLAKQPSVWHAVGKEQAALGSHFDKMTASMLAQSELAMEELKARESEERTLGKTEKHWSSIANSSRAASTSSKSVESSIAGASTSMLKWSSILGGVAAAAGVVVAGFAAGVEMYEKAASIAGRVGSERRSAQGLGMSIGEHRAFGLDFSRITDTDSFLGNVEEMMTDPSKTGPLWRAGINPNGSTTQVATGYMDWLRKVAVATPVNQLGQLNHRWGSQVPIDTWMRLHNMSADEYATDVRGKFENDRSEAGGLGINDRAARTTQNFATQALRADMRIENIFDKKVAQLSSHLTDVSKAFVGLAQKVATGSVFDKGVDALGRGIDWIANKGIPTLESGFDGLGKAVAAVTQTIEKVNQTTKKWSGEDPKSKTTVSGVLRRPWDVGGSMSDSIGSGIDKALGAMGIVPEPAPNKGTTDLHLSPIVGDHPTSWNPAPISNSYAANRSNVSNTTNNYGGRGGGSVNINIIAPPGFSANTTLSGLNAGLV